MKARLQCRLSGVWPQSQSIGLPTGLGEVTVIYARTVGFGTKEGMLRPTRIKALSKEKRFEGGRRRNG